MIQSLTGIEESRGHGGKTIKIPEGVSRKILNGAEYRYARIDDAEFF